MWRLEKDPHLSSTFANVTILDRPPDFDRLLRRMERATDRGRAAAPAGAAGAGQPHRADVGRRRQLRHPLPRPPHGAAEARHDAPAARPGQPDRLRSVRAHPAAVAVRRRRRAARRQVGADREAAPHDHRRRGQRAAVAAVPRLRARRARTAAARSGDARSTAEPTTAAARQPATCCATCWPAACACRSACSARSATCSPTRPASPTPATPRPTPCAASISQLSDTEQARSPLWTERSLQRRMEVLRAPFGETQGGRQAARRHAEHRVPHRRRRGRRPLPHRDGRSRSSSCGPAWRSAPAPSRPGANAFSLARMLVPTGEMPIAERFAAIQAAAGAARECDRRRRRSRRWPPSPPTLPTSLVTRLARQQAQTVDFATSQRARRTGAAVRRRRAAAGELPGRPAGRRGVQPDAAAATTTASTWASTSTRPRWPNRSCCARCLETRVRGPAARP